MCFSAGASFGSSAVLLVIGIVSLSKSQKKAHYLLACIPLFFCLQQFMEGMVWLALMHTKYHRWEQVATYGFLIFAEIVWPLTVPLIILTVETEKKRKKVLRVFMGTGVCIVLYLLWGLLFFPVYPTIMGHHIRYRFDFPFSHAPAIAIFYLIATVTPPFISSIKPMRWLGAVLFISFIVTTLFNKVYFISVWCYFAALLSVISLYIILYLKKHPVLSE